MTKKGIYVEGQIRIHDAIIEKGKGPILGKLRITQLIEADLQLIMRICIDIKREKKK